MPSRHEVRLSSILARVHLTFEGLTVPADIDCPPELFPALATFGVAAVEAPGPGPASIIVKSRAGRFHLSGPAYQSPFSVEGLDAVAGSIMAGLAACKSLAVPPNVLCIHGACASMNGNSYLILAPFGGGKSSLVAELAALGADILADDVVLVDTQALTIAGLRIPMRLRQGFVNSAGADMRDWIDARSIMRGQRYVFLTPEALSAGARPLTDIVLLNRAPKAAEDLPLLEPASHGRLMPRLLWHNMSRHHAPSAITGMAARLAESLRGSILHFADAGQAARLLLRGEMSAASAAPRSLPESSQRDDLHITRTDLGAIIADDETGRVFEINESAHVMLTVLQKFDDDETAWDMLCAVYPDAPRRELASQLTRCLRQFAEAGLIDISRAQSFRINSESP
ncbi:MAG: hypothetical protein RJA94_1033 [Pseudomonadota bacterium]